MCTLENGLKKLQQITEILYISCMQGRLIFKAVIGPVYLKDTSMAILSGQCIANYISFICFGGKGEKDLQGGVCVCIFNCL